MEIRVFIGSLRRGSYNRKLFEVYRSLSPAEMNFKEACFHDFPHYNQDIEDRAMPDEVLREAEQVKNADGLLFVSPEYNYSIPGALKNAIDWLSRIQPVPFTNKPASIMGASTGRIGTARAQYDLRKMGVFLNIHFMNQPEIMLATAQEAFDEHGNLKNGQTRKILIAHSKAFKLWITSLKSLETSPSS